MRSLSKFLVCLAFGISNLAQALEIRNTDAISTPEVAQREFLLTTADQHALIQTSSVFTCVALALYHPKTRTGMLAHLDAPTLVEESIKHIVASFKALGIPAAELTAHMSGAYSGSSYKEAVETDERLVLRIAGALKAAKIKIVTKDVLTPPRIPGSDTRAVELDLRTGDFYYFEDRSISPKSSPEREKQKEKYVWFDLSRNAFLCDTLLNPHPESLVVKDVPFQQATGRDCSAN